METISKSECLLEKVTKLPITLITIIFGYTSDYPISFVYLISKSKKMQSIIHTLLSNISEKNQLTKEENEFIIKYKASEVLYLDFLEKTISKKIHGLPLKLPLLQQEYKKKVYCNTFHRNFVQLFDKYQSLEIFCSNGTYFKKKNRWFLRKLSEKNLIYFNNCIFMVNNIINLTLLLYSTSFFF